MGRSALIRRVVFDFIYEGLFMARIRTIKPEFWTSDQIIACSRDARLLFIGLLNFCDDAGIHTASVSKLKVEIFPAEEDLDSTSIRRMVDELLSNGLIIEFEVDGQRYWEVTGWAKHQKIDKPSYKYPTSQSKCASVVNSTSIRRTFDEHSTTDWKGKEGKGKKEKDKSFSCAEPKNFDSTLPAVVDKKFITVPLCGKEASYDITETQVTEWQELYPGIDVRQELRGLVGWNQSNPTKRKTKSGILRHVNSWLASAQNRMGGRTALSSSRGTTGTPVIKPTALQQYMAHRESEAAARRNVIDLTEVSYEQLQKT